MFQSLLQSVKEFMNVEQHPEQVVEVIHLNTLEKIKMLGHFYGWDIDKDTDVKIEGPHPDSLVGCYIETTDPDEPVGGLRKGPIIKLINFMFNATSTPRRVRIWTKTMRGWRDDVGHMFVDINDIMD
jgi:hypothetical protein